MEKVKLTGVNTAQLPVLSNKEMLDLFNRMNNGEIEARNQIVNGNLKLVLSVLQKFRNNSHPLDDLFQVGCIGLVKAVDNFKVDKGVRFSTYAVPMILGEVRRYIRDNREIRVSRSLRKIAYRTLKLRDELLKKRGKEPSLEEISQKLDIPRSDIIYALEATKSPISIFTPIFEDEGEPLRIMDQISDKGGIGWIEEINMRRGFEVLSARERLIINLRFYEGETQEEISNRVGVSQAQISRIQKKALEKLKSAIELKEEAK
ncbi:SigB/SigF/SigG family RNA polymerase sigma factor [Orenia marismortui]|uniref:RNA polymerase sigma factor n=1 Tax=Orenia marismortui TaxID=46469 RepID=A0A4R8GU73_9FIRM|nr:RNA polymerase sporulation-specific sigma factor [Orenia marismortui]